MTRELGEVAFRMYNEESDFTYRLASKLAEAGLVRFEQRRWLGLIKDRKVFRTPAGDAALAAAAGGAPGVKLEVALGGGLDPAFDAEFDAHYHSGGGRDGDAGDGD